MSVSWVITKRSKPPFYVMHVTFDGTFHYSPDLQHAKVWADIDAVIPVLSSWVEDRIPSDGDDNHYELYVSSDRSRVSVTFQYEGDIPEPVFEVIDIDQALVEYVMTA